MRGATVVALVGFVACTGAGDDTDDSDTGDTADSGDTADTADTGDSGDDTDAERPDDNGLSLYGPLPTREPDEALALALADGSTFEDLGWAQRAYCWPGTANDAFTGAHLHVERGLGAGQTLYARAAPGEGVDVSVYLLVYPLDGGAYPPDVASAVRCEAMYGRSAAGNPWQAEVVSTFDTQPRELLIGIAGADETAAGDVQLELWWD